VIGGTTGFGTHARNPYVREVESLADSILRAQGGDIRFTGYLHHDRDLPAWFQKATLFASPSIFQEPFGLVNAEAMACATPVVGATRGGIPEVLGNAGILVNPEDIQEFAEALSALLGNREYAAALGRAAYERCRELFGWDVISQCWSSFLHELAETP
jgi:glycosyltransferase involved in cell wall biosynthesis